MSFILHSELPKEIKLEFFHKYLFQKKEFYLEEEAIKIINYFTMELMIKKLTSITNNVLKNDFSILCFNNNLYFDISYLEKTDFKLLFLTWSLEDIDYSFKKNNKYFISYTFLKTFISNDFIEFYNNNYNTNKNTSININKYIQNQKTYLMIDLDGYVKIGKSKNPQFREKTLQREIPKITLFAVNDDNIEKELHDKYKKNRVRGEWFKLDTNEILDIINQYNFKRV